MPHAVRQTERRLVTLTSIVALTGALTVATVPLAQAAETDASGRAGSAQQNSVQAIRELKRGYDNRASKPNSGAPMSPGGTLKSITFDGQPVGAVRPANFNAETGGTERNTARFDDMTIVRDGRGSGNVLRTKLDANTLLTIPKGQNNGASGMFFGFTPTDRACVSYDVRFSPNFQFGLGGKLPGLQGTAPGVSLGAPGGGHPTSDGWSGRLMWNKGAPNRISSYMYHPGQKTQWGDNVYWNSSFAAGKWHTVTSCYRMNSVNSNGTPNADGVLRTYLDGRQVVDDTRFVYRTRKDVHVSHISWSIFRGGNTADWAVPTDGYVDVDNVQVTTF